jgi:hypothetical protein
LRKRDTIRSSTPSSWRRAGAIGGVIDKRDKASAREKNPDLFQKLEGLETASVFFDSVSDGFMMSGLAYLPDQAQAGELYSYLADRKSQVLSKEGANVFLGSFLVMSNIIRDENFVRWNLHLTEKAFTDLWNTKMILKPGQ